MSARVVLALVAGLAMSACGGPGPAADVPVRHASQPAPGLQLTSSLDHSRVQTGALHLELELKNTGSAPVGLPGSYCRVTPVTSIQDANGTVVWSQPIPMLECANPLADDLQSIPPAGQRTGSYCWQLNQRATPCSALDLPSGTYRVTGSFFTYPIPSLDFQIVR